MSRGQTAEWMHQVVTDENIEEILLLSCLTGMTIVDAAYAVIPEFDHLNITMTVELTTRLFAVKKKLDDITKQAHSSHTQQPEYVNAEEG